jgi:cytochrome c oxidase assembly protein subunit 15
LILQAVLGGIVVWFHLSAVKVSIHLVNAFIFTSLLLWALMKLVRPATILNRFASNPILPLATGVFAICLIQLFSGGIMAGSKAGYQINTWPAMGDSMVPPHLWDKELNAYHNFTKNILFVQFFHRWFAFIVAIAVLFLAFRSFTVQVSPVARWALRLAPAIVFLQIVLGVLTLLSQVNHHLALTHQSIGLVLLLTILVVLYETKYHPVLAEEALADRAEAARASKEALHA